jgi:hypothetical protein
MGEIRRLEAHPVPWCLALIIIETSSSAYPYGMLTRKTAVGPEVATGIISMGQTDPPRGEQMTAKTKQQTSLTPAQKAALTRKRRAAARKAVETKRRNATD